MEKLIKKLIKKYGGISKMESSLNTEIKRDEFIISELAKLPANLTLLDAGCGNQKYRPYCKHLTYKAQDLGEYTRDEKESITKTEAKDYVIGKLDYKGDVWDIDEKDATFDVILCTEVFEHIPYPVESIKEFSRLLKPGGKLILTMPASSNRHFDPYYFYAGFSDRWVEYFLPKYNFKEFKIIPASDYYRYVTNNMYNIAINSNWLAKILLAPGILYLFNKKKTEGSVNYQCSGYYVLATKSS